MDQSSVDVMGREPCPRPNRIWRPCNASCFPLSWLRERGETRLRLLAAGLLLFAAGLKYLHLATTPPMPDDSGWQHWFWVALIEFELFWGIWLLMGNCSRFTRQASALLFALFAAFSAYGGVVGRESCGCFGVVSVKPWLAFVADVLFAAAFLSIRTKGELTSAKTALSLRRLAAVLAVWTLFGVPIVIFSSGPKWATISEDGEIVGAEKVVLLDPRQWMGKRFPLVKHIDEGPTFARGRWRLLFVRPGCPYCEEALRQLLSCSPLETRDDEARWAVVVLPSLTESISSTILPPHANIPLGRLDKDKIWIANIPFTLVVNDGIVLEWTPGVPPRT